MLNKAQLRQCHLRLPCSQWPVLQICLGNTKLCHQHLDTKQRNLPDCYFVRFPYQVLSMIDNPHYLYRMTVLSAIAALAPVVTHDILANSMLPVVINAGKDKVRLDVRLHCVI